jgi:hypothetical protein
MQPRSFRVEIRIALIEGIKNFWMGHKPRTISELYSHLFEEVELRLAESAQAGVGFDIPAYIAPKDLC